MQAETEEQSKEPKIVIDVTTLKEDVPDLIQEVEEGSTDCSEDEKSLPVGFRSKEPAPKKKRKCLVEAVEEDAVSRSDEWILSVTIARLAFFFFAFFFFESII